MIARYWELAVATAALALVVVWVAFGEGGFWPFDLPSGRATLFLAVTNPDCEVLRAGERLTQPANALSAFALSGAGLGLLAAVGRHRAKRQLAGPGGAALGLALVALGAGSFAFHADPSSALAWLDAAGVSLVAAAWLTWNVARAAGWPAFAAAGAAAAAATVVLPEGAGRVFQLVLVAAAAASEARAWSRPRDRRRLAATVATFAVAVPVWLLSRDGGLLCEPASALQGHALWHLLAAAGLALGTWYLWSERVAPPASGPGPR